MEAIVHETLSNFAILGPLPRTGLQYGCGDGLAWEVGKDAHRLGAIYEKVRISKSSHE